MNNNSHNAICESNNAVPNSETNCCSTAVVQPSARATAEGTIESVRPAVDIYEVEDAVVLTADVPGACESTVELELEKGVLKLQAEVASSAPAWAQGHQRPHRRYVRTFRVSDDLDAHSAEAVVENGVLTIRFPKRAEAVPTKISVRQAT